MDFCQADIDVLCCPREWTLIGWDGRCVFVSLQPHSHHSKITEGNEGRGRRVRQAPHWPIGPRSSNDSVTFSLVSPHIFCHASSTRSDSVCSARFCNAAVQRAALLPLQVATATLQSTAALICNSWLTVVSCSGPPKLFAPQPILM